MFQSFFEPSKRAWYFFEQLTLLHNYKLQQRNVIDGYLRYRYVLEKYSELTGRKIQPVTHEYLKEHDEVTQENMALLKNSIELWMTALKTTKAVAPILFHYSWHCFNSFLAYTFFRWKPPHGRGHGIKISKWSDNLQDVKIQFGKGSSEKTPGLFQRVVDTLTLLGLPSAFSEFLPVWKNDKEMEFIPNKQYLLKKSNEISLGKLLAFNAGDFARELENEIATLNPQFIVQPRYLPTKLLKSYIIAFAASSFARYRPIQWSKVMLGKTFEETTLAIEWNKAIHDYTLGSDASGLLLEIESLFSIMNVGKFFFKNQVKIN